MNRTDGLVSTGLAAGVLATLLAMVAAIVGPARADPAADEFNAAKALGQDRAASSMTDLRNGSSEATVKAAAPAYTSTPPEKAYYTNKNLGGGASDQQAFCSTHPDDDTCAGLRAGTQPRPATDVTAASPSLAAQAVVDNPTLVLGDVARTYNACATGGEVVSPATWERRSCSLEAPSWSDSACFKTLSTHPKEFDSCKTGDLLVSQVLRPEGDPMSIEAVCNLATGPVVPFTFNAWGSHGTCSGPRSVSIDLGRPQPQGSAAPPIVAELQPRWHGGCFPMEVLWEGPGCQDHRCELTIHFVQAPGVLATAACAGPDQLTGDQITFVADPPPPATDCYSGFLDEAAAGGRPGWWGTTGVSILYWVSEGPPVTGWAWAPGEHYASRLSFVEPYFIPATGDVWSSTCKPYEDITPGLAADGINATPPPPIPTALGPGEPQCVRTSSVCTDGPATRTIDGLDVTRECWAFSNTFACTALAATSSCADPALRSCSAAAAPSCTGVDAGGHCLTATQDFDCKLKEATFTPSLNCGDATFCANGSCYDTTTGPNDQFAYSFTQLQAHKEAGKDFDTATLQIFKGRDSRCHQENFGIDNCCVDSAYLEKCAVDEQDTVHDRDAGKCHAVGEYCSARSLGVCRDTTHTYCCFSSLLARLVQEQGRAQIGRDWGTPQTPNCVGFTPAEITALDWSAFDLSEFYAQIHASPPAQGDVQTQVGNQQTNCYYGDGRC